MEFFKDIRLLRRVSRVVSVLASNSLGHYIEEFELKSHMPFFKKLSLQEHQENSLPAKLRISMEQLGGFYVKLGQFLSLRPDLVPEEYRTEFTKLQDNVKPMEFSEVSAILKKELGKELDDIFEDISEVAIGSASIAQAHVAKLKSGETVILKIKRPGIEKLFAQDTEVLYYLAEKIEKKAKYKNFAPTLFVKEFERYTQEELNFLVEAGNIETFYKTFKDDKDVKIPRIYRDYCTSNLLVIEYIKGKKLYELSQKELKKNRKKLASSLVNLCLKQVFESGVFHADLHPGNIIVTADGRIALIDFGIIGRLNEQIKSKGIDLYIALIIGNPDEVVDALLALGKKTPDFDINEFRSEVESIITAWYNTSLKQHRITSMMHRLLDSSMQHGLKMPVDAVLLGKALVTVEGTCLQLDPNFNFVKFSESHIEKIARKKLDSQSTLKKFLQNSKKLKEIAYELPFESYSLIKKLNEGDITLDIDDVEIKNLANNLDKSSTVLSKAIIIAAIIVALALILSGKLDLPQNILIIIFISMVFLAILSFIVVKRR